MRYGYIYSTGSFWVPSHIYAKVNLSWEIFYSLACFCFMFYLQLLFHFWSLLHLLIFFYLCGLNGSLISKSSPAALHSGHQTWFEIQMLTLVIRFLLLCHLAQEREQLSTHPAMFQTLLRKQNKRASPEIQKPHKIRSCTRNPKHEQRDNSVLLINKENKYWTMETSKEITGIFIKALR